MKTTCNGCRALGGMGINQRCILGYPVTTEKHHFGGPGEYLWRARPQIECPKPRTWKALTDLRIELKLPANQDLKLAQVEHRIWARQKQVLGLK